jgi:hypothetical protein
MQTTAALDLTVWRNDTVWEFPLRVIGPNLTGVALAAQIREAGDMPGPPLADLAQVANGNAEGVRLAGVTQLPDGTWSNDIRIRLNKSTRQAFPYMGSKAGDPATLAWGFLIAGITRAQGSVSVPAQVYGSDAAPLNRPASFGMRSGATSPSSGATLTISQDGGATLAIDGADLIGPMVSQAEAARDAVRPIYGYGPPAADIGIPGSFYRDMTNPLEPLEWFKTEAGWQGPQSLKGTPGGHVMSAGPFTVMRTGTVPVPEGALVVRTSSYGPGGSILASSGAAFYVRDDALVAPAYAAANPRWTFRAPVSSELGAVVHGYRLEGFKFDIEVFGGVGDDFAPGVANDPLVTPSNNATDNVPAFLAASAYCRAQKIRSSVYAAGVDIKLDSYYYFSSSLELPMTMRLQGRHYGSNVSTIVSRVRFPRDCSGFIVPRFDTTGASGPTNGNTTATPGVFGADGSQFDGLYIVGGFIKGVTPDGPYHGLVARARFLAINCVFAAWQGYGTRIDVTASTSPDNQRQGNANLWFMSRCGFTNNDIGLYIGGADANSGAAEYLNFASNRRIGMVEASFLGNSHKGHHATANGLAAAVIPTIATYQGNRYSVKYGAEVLASTTVPGTDANVWLFAGAGGASAPNNIVEWVTGLTWASGASYVLTSNNAVYTLDNCYHEGGQGYAQVQAPWQVSGGNVPVVGSGPKLAPTSTGDLISSRAVGARLALDPGGPGTGAVTTMLGDNENLDTIIGTSHSTQAPLVWRLKYDAGMLSMLYANQATQRPFSVGGPLSSRTYGRATAVRYQFEVPRVFVGPSNNARCIEHGATASPASGEYAPGDIIFRRNPAPGGKIGWVCTTGGVAGAGAVFKEWGLIDP